MCLHLDFRTEDSTGTGVEVPLDRLSELFQVPRERVKLIHRGRVVDDEGKLRELSRSGATLTLVASRVAGPGTYVARTRMAWLESYSQLQLAAEVLWRNTVLPLLGMLRVFFASISPVMETR